MNTQRREELQRVAEEASRWLDALAEDDRPEVRAAFAAWIAESPLHVREFLNISAIDRQLAGVDPQQRMRVEGTGQGPRNVLAMRIGQTKEPVPAPKVRPRAIRWRAAAAVATLAVGGAAWMLWQHPPGWSEYATVTGEQSAVKLPDGSMVHLNTRSRLLVRFTAQARDIRLMEGEALFKVERDAARPFRVLSRDATVQALGTEFNVYRRNADTTVSVLEGAVKVSVDTRDAPVLSAGQQVSVTRDGAVTRPARADVGRTMAWRERRLVFHADTVADIAAEFNRYNASPRIRIESEALKERRFTGVLDADKPESLMRFLDRERDVVFDRRAGELVVRIRSAAKR